MTTATYADLARPATKTKAWVYDMTLVAAGSLLIALSARLRIPLPFTPVPITGQTLAILLAGALLGSRRGALTVALYLAEGALGLPVFQGGNAGVDYMTGPTGGYLAGFLIAAWLTGWLAERGWDRKAWTALLAMLAGNATIYIFGLAWLAIFVGWNKALPLGFYPFIIDDLLKIALATALLPSGWKLVGNRNRQR